MKRKPKEQPDGDMQVLPPEGGDPLTPEQALERRLDFLENIYLNPSLYPGQRLTGLEYKELQQYRPKIWNKGAGANGSITPGGVEIPQFEITTQAGMAEALSRRFKFACSEQDVSDWKLSKRLPRVSGEQAPPFPSPSTRGRWPDGREAFLWFERWIVEPSKNGSKGSGDLGTLAREAELRTKLHNEESARMSMEAMKRELDKTWCKREGAKRAALEAAGVWVRVTEEQVEKTGVQRRKDKLVSIIADCGLVIADWEKVLEQFYAFDLELAREMMDAVRAGCNAKAQRTRSDAESTKP